MSSVFEADRPRFRLVPCPHCGKPLKLVAILYGYPAPEAWEAELRGELAIGGCLVGDNDPEFACSNCGEPVPG
jgi:predicted RNA-binding Zn-ribbon protein involved in translation (DUF1610 family)